MAEETRSEQLNQKITPTARKKLDDVLKRMGHPADGDGHVKWDQDRLMEVLGVVESTLVLDEHENYAEVVTSINQYTSLINSKLISLISDLDTTEARIRSEYEKKLESKDLVIKDLQEQRATQENAKNTAIEDASKSKDAQTIAEKNLSDAEEKLQKAEDMVKDKESIIQMLNGKLKESEDKLSGYDALRASESSLRDQVTLVLHQKELAESELRHEAEQVKAAEKTIDTLKTQLVQVQSEMAASHDENQSLKRDLEELQRSAEQDRELAIERAVAKAKDDLQEEMLKIRDEKTRLEVQLDLFQKSKK